METLYIILALLGGIGIIALIIRRESKKTSVNFDGKRAYLDKEVIARAALEDISKKAQKAAKEFMAWIHSPDSPIPRRERRRVKRHFMKFLYAWPSIPPKHREVSKIVYYLAEQPRNHYVVQGYISAMVGADSKARKEQEKEPVTD